MQNQTIRFDLQLPYEVKKEGKWFIAACPVLDVYSQGTTDAKAKKNLIEALQLFIESCYERGTLDQVLKESGFDTMTRKGPRSHGEKLLDVSLFLVGKQHAPAHSG